MMTSSLEQMTEDVEEQVEEKASFFPYSSSSPRLNDDHATVCRHPLKSTKMLMPILLKTLSLKRMRS